MHPNKGRSVCSIGAAICLALPGCSLFTSSTQLVQVTTNEANAEITIDGSFVGKGSTSTSLQRDRDHVVMVRLDDRISTAVIGHEISALGILDLVGGFFLLFPFIGIAGDGFWDLDPQSIVIVLPPAPKASP